MCNCTASTNWFSATLTRLRLPTHPQHPPHPPPVRPPPIESIHDIGGVQKKVSQNPAVLAR